MSAAKAAPPDIFKLSGGEPQERIDELTRLLHVNEQGLVPAIVQQFDTGDVLMMAWMTPASLAETIELGETVFWSRSRQERWHKGATSGNTQKVIDIQLDCDTDTLLIRVDQGPDGVACHTGTVTCFRPLDTGSNEN